MVERPARAREAAATPSPLPLEVEHIVDLIAQNTGHEVNRATWEKRRAERELLRVQTRELAAKLEEAGVSTRTGEQIELVGLATGFVERVESWRNINFLPEVASRNRAPYLRSFEYFSDSHPYQRYFTVSSGVRCPINEVRERLLWLHRELKRFANSEVCKRFGARFTVRADEVTIKWELEKNAFTCNVHTNVVIDFDRVLGPGYAEFLRAFHAHFGNVRVQENGRVRDTREIIKYITKPGEVLQLGAADLAELHKQLFGLHLVQAYGEFREVLQSLDAEGVTVRKRRVVNDGIEEFKWVKVQRHRRPPPSEEATWRHDHGIVLDASATDVVLSILPPAPYFVNRCEPALLVRRYSGSLPRLIELNQLHDVEESANRAWCSSILDTCTTNGGKEPSPSELCSLQCHEGCTDFPDLPLDEALYWMSGAADG